MSTPTPDPILTEIRQLSERLAADNSPLAHRQLMPIMYILRRLAEKVEALEGKTQEDGNPPAPLSH